MFFELFDMLHQATGDHHYLLILISLEKCIVNILRSPDDIARKKERPVVIKNDRLAPVGTGGDISVRRICALVCLHTPQKHTSYSGVRAKDQHNHRQQKSTCQRCPANSGWVASEHNYKAHG